MRALAAALLMTSGCSFVFVRRAPREVTANTRSPATRSPDPRSLPGGPDR